MAEHIGSLVRRTTVLRTVVLALLLLVASGCSSANTSDEGTSTSGDRSTTITAATDAASRGVRESDGSTIDDAPFTLIVSSQSYDQDEVQMEVEVDGKVLTDEAFGSSGHEYVYFPLDLDPGEHQVTVTAADGTTLDVPVDLPAERRWMIVSYWSGEGEGRHFTHDVVSDPPGFA